MPSAGNAVQVSDGAIALRFLDPLDRRDRSGRPIPHEFVLTGPDAADVQTVEDGIQKIWPLVAEYYDRVWAKNAAPSVNE